jgi:hypothetical protein
MIQSQLCFHILAGWDQFPRHQLHQMVFVCNQGRIPSSAGIDHLRNKVFPDLTDIGPTEQIFHINESLIQMNFSRYFISSFSC